ncbi:MAG TPA: hypothetical protein VM529_18940 [Gemmata sp.]|nr:hypothetical protein [Gemmata sp.]
MRTIETRAVVTADHTITLTLPEDIPPGECRVVLVIENGKPPVSLWAGWEPHDVELVDPDNTFRREDTYGDDGR